MKIKNRTGPRTDPWGTPLTTLFYRRMAENGFAPPLGNFADISYLVEN